MDDIDRTFEKLKRVDYSTILGLVSNRFTVNPYTFELNLHKLYHHIVTDRGWTIDEFLNEVNHRKFT